MTCKHALDLIDIGPFADVSRAQLDALQAHARECAACARALQAADALTVDLHALAQPAAPPELTARVMAQIARLEPADEAPARARSIGLVSLTALAAGLLLLLWAMREGQAGLNVHVFGGVGAIQTTGAASIGLAAGLALYVAGLFIPVSRRHLKRS